MLGCQIGRRKSHSVQITKCQMLSIFIVSHFPSTSKRRTLNCSSRNWTVFLVSFVFTLLNKSLSIYRLFMLHSWWDFSLNCPVCVACTHHEMGNHWKPILQPCSEWILKSWIGFWGEISPNVIPFILYRMVSCCSYHSYQYHVFSLLMSCPNK